MMVKVNELGGKLTVLAPYNSVFVAAARALNGKFSDGVWHFDSRDRARVEAACMEAYGCDGVRSDTVTLRIEWRVGGRADRGPIEVAGRTVARAFGRDGGAKLGEGVVLLAGRFSSGGSMKNWCTEVATGTVVLVRDFPRAAAERLIAAQSDSDRRRYSIEPEVAPVDRAALEGERARLVARIAEIDAALSAGGAA